MTEVKGMQANDFKTVKFLLSYFHPMCWAPSEEIMHQARQVFKFQLSGALS